MVTKINGLASEIFPLLVTSWPFKEKLNFKPWVTSTIMSSNFFQFTQIWHFCNGLNPNKAQMSFVWGWNRQMGKKRETEKALSLVFSWDFRKMTLPLAYHLEFSVFFAKWKQQQTVERLSAVLIPVFFFCKAFFSFLELFLVTLLHGEVFFLPLKKEEIFKLNQQLKGTIENSPIKVTHFQRLDSHSKLLF